MLLARPVFRKATAVWCIYLSCWATARSTSLSSVRIASAFSFTSFSARSASSASSPLSTLSSRRFTMTAADSSEGDTTTSPPVVNLLDLVSAAIACTVTASRCIKRVSSEDAKNSRLKVDGSVVTDADFIAQGVICKAITSVSKHVRIVGEESAEEMASHTANLPVEESEDHDIREKCLKELRLRYHKKDVKRLPLAQIIETTTTDESENDNSDYPDMGQLSDPEHFTVDASRVSVIVDPLDGTKSYASGEYDCVSILIGIILDKEPYFGVIGKPFGYTGLSSILDSGCVTIYGGPMINGVYVAGGDPVVPIAIDTSTALEDLPRAVISSSRSKGLIHDFCIHLGEQGLVYPEPMLISGAGEKSLRLILQRKNEALWFYPKAGTSLWDVAAPDALLRALGGKMSDKFGRDMDYSKNRDEAENINGVVACIDAKLHETCIRLFEEGEWGEKIY